jgi:hypothetical protein
MMWSVKQSVRSRAVSLLWTVRVFDAVVSSVHLMVELPGIRWVCVV